MPRFPGNFQRFANKVCDDRQRSVQIEPDTYSFPLFVYSYSSRGFADLPERYRATRNLVPVQLVSLYDHHYHLSCSGMPITQEDATAIRFFDSGTYETEEFADTPGFHEPPGKQPWSEELYIESAKSIVRTGDVLVSYDDRSLSIVDQVKQGLVLFERAELQGIKRDLLLHPNGTPPDALAKVIIELAPDIDIIGLTEKDIGFPWFIAASYIRQLRMNLDSSLERYIPIHIFGCFDPQTIPYLFFSGADIFDGLSWMRYYFRDGHSFYYKEFEYDTQLEKLLDPKVAMQNLLGHNVEELERLRADLQYAVLTRDVSQFKICLENLQAFDLIAI